MAYDFTTLRDRTGTGSPKWDGMKTAPAGTVPFSVADMEFVNPPEVIEALKEYLDTHILGYTFPTAAYEEAVCGWMQRTHGWTVDPRELVITPGVVPALYYGVRILTRPGEGVIVMPPVYGPFYDAARRTGRKSVHCPLIQNDKGWAMDFPLLETLCAQKDNTLLILCSPHNPVGRVWTRQELERVGRICKENGVALISDEIHCDILMPGYTHVSMGTLAEFRDNLVVCTAPSKTFNLATMQTANLVIPNPETRARFVTHKENHCVESQNALGFAACTAAYSHGGDWYRQMLAVIYENYQLLKDFLADTLPQIGLSPLMATYLAWIDCRALEAPHRTLMEAMTENHLYFSSGEDFGAQGQGFLRMNLACPKGVLQEAFPRFEAAVRGLLAHSSL